jgi:hypothetical protein
MPPISQSVHETGSNKQTSPNNTEVHKCGPDNQAVHTTGSHKIEHSDYKNAWATGTGGGTSHESQSEHRCQFTTLVATNHVVASAQRQETDGVSA